MVGFSFLVLTFHSSGDVKGRLQDWGNCLEVTGLGLILGPRLGPVNTLPTRGGRVFTCKME